MPEEVCSGSEPGCGEVCCPDVELIMSDASTVGDLADGSLDVAFASNFFRHLPSKQQLFEVLSEIHRFFRRGGKLLIIQPNIKYAYREYWGEYWDFIDHTTYP